MLAVNTNCNSMLISVKKSAIDDFIAIMMASGYFVKINNKQCTTDQVVVEIREE